MKKILFAAAILCSSFISCKKSGTNTNYYGTTPTPTGTGTVIFWTPDAVVAGCGVTVHLNNGDQSTITSIYPSTPTSCSNVYGGYFNEAPASYTYTITTTGGCTYAGGSVIISSGGCSYIKVQ